MTRRSNHLAFLKEMQGVMTISEFSSPLLYSKLTRNVEEEEEKMISCIAEWKQSPLARIVTDTKWYNSLEHRDWVIEQAKDYLKNLIRYYGVEKNCGRLLFLASLITSAILFGYEGDIEFSLDNLSSTDIRGIRAIQQEFIAGFLNEEHALYPKIWVDKLKIHP